MTINQKGRHYNANFANPATYNEKFKKPNTHVPKSVQYPRFEHSNNKPSSFSYTTDHQKKLCVDYLYPHYQITMFINQPGSIVTFALVAVLVLTTTGVVNGRNSKINVLFFPTGNHENPQVLSVSQRAIKKWQRRQAQQFVVLPDDDDNLVDVISVINFQSEDNICISINDEELIKRGSARCATVTKQEECNNVAIAVGVEAYADIMDLGYDPTDCSWAFAKGNHSNARSVLGGNRATAVGVNALAEAFGHSGNKAKARGEHSTAIVSNGHSNQVHASGLRSYAQAHGGDDNFISSSGVFAMAYANIGNNQTATADGDNSWAEVIFGHGVARAHGDSSTARVRCKGTNCEAHATGKDVVAVATGNNGSNLIALAGGKDGSVAYIGSDCRTSQVFGRDDDVPDWFVVPTTTTTSEEYVYYLGVFDSTCQECGTELAACSQSTSKVAM